MDMALWVAPLELRLLMPPWAFGVAVLSRKVTMKPSVGDQEQFMAQTPGPLRVTAFLKVEQETVQQSPLLSFHPLARRKRFLVEVKEQVTSAVR
jgi:hypothetical protein